MGNYDWMEEALCAQTDPDAFFPDKGGKSTAQAALQVCQSCTVKKQCETYSEGEVRGVWAGMSAQQRLKSERKRRRKG